MRKNEAYSLPETVVVRDALVISAVCFVRQSLVEILEGVDGVRVCGEAATAGQALERVRVDSPALVLMDAAFPQGTVIARQIGAVLPGVGLIALGVRETETEVLAWAEAGIAGYVPDTATIKDLIALIGQICQGEQTCPSRIAGSLLRRIAAIRRAPSPSPNEALVLTAREREVLHLVGAGLSNKDIARKLDISLGTTKSHVHNLLAKLSLRRRADVMIRLSGS
jgi:two-component system, NarL family, nitrate/nitrite response regulator NarL